MEFGRGRDHHAACRQHERNEHAGRKIEDLQSTELLGPTLPQNRVRKQERHVDADGFAFPQQLNPHVAEPGWRPRFVDYLYVGFTNATAFSPTDAMPLAPWAKIAMAVQATVSLSLLGLVVARAVNVLG
jgi:hypothetical protein